MLTILEVQVVPTALKTTQAWVPLTMAPSHSAFLSVWWTFAETPSFFDSREDSGPPVLNWVRWRISASSYLTELVGNSILHRPHDQIEAVVVWWYWTDAKLTLLRHASAQPRTKRETGKMPPNVLPSFWFLLTRQKAVKPGGLCPACAWPVAYTCRCR